jgi:hypothetical protein
LERVQDLFDNAHDLLQKVSPAERRRILKVLVSSVAYTLEAEGVNPDVVEYFRETAVEQ